MRSSLLARIQERCSEHGQDSLLYPHPGVSWSTRTEFWAEAMGLRDELLRLGIRPGTRVGLILPSGADLLTAIVATWAAGASFVPLDPAEPTPRRAAIVEQAQLSMILVQDPMDEVAGLGATVVMAGGRLCQLRTPAVQATTCQLGDEAYVIFTSGSTGRPKGVSVSHDGIDGYIDAARTLYAVPDRGVLIPAQLPPTFDAALTALLLPLVTSNPVLPLADPRSATRALADVLRACSSPFLIKTTPAQLRLLGDLLTAAEVDALAGHGGTIIVGGEALDFADLVPFRRQGIAIVNEYGPTETTVGCSAYRVQQNDPDFGPVPIGNPFPGVTFAIDGADALGVGELVIAGPGVANGYVGDRDNPRFFTLGTERAYRSGDMVHAGPDGVYYFHGRTDDQVKVNGYRIDLGEVDIALRQAFGAPGAAFVQEGLLVAVVETGRRDDFDHGWAQLRGLLPAYMQPTGIRSVPELPLTPHGKVDRGELRRSVVRGDDARGVDRLTQTVTSLWEQALPGQQIQERTDFFAAGAHSITALTMTGRLADELDADVPIWLVFDSPVLADYVAALSKQLTGNASPDTVPSKPIGIARTPASTQLAILGAEAWAADPAEFTVAAAARFSVPDWDALLTAVTRALHRHEVLSWRFGLDRAHQITARPGSPVPLEVEDLRGLPAADAQRQIDERLAHERLRAIDLLGGDTPTRMLIMRQSPFAGVLALVAHHAVVDEASVALLWREVVSQLAGRKSRLQAEANYQRWAEKTVSAKALKQARISAAELAHQLSARMLGHLGTGTDGPAGSATIAVPVDASQAAEAVAARLSLPLSAVYGAAAAAALRPFMTHSRFPVIVPVTGRRTAADFVTVGCFVTAVPLAADVPVSGPIDDDWVRDWHRTLLRATAGPHPDGETLATLMRAAVPTWPNIPRVSVVIETPPSPQTGDTILWSAIPALPGPPKHHLSVFLTAPFAGPAHGRVEWRAGAFNHSRAQDLIQGLADALVALGGDSGPKQPSTGQADLAERLASVAALISGGTVTTRTDLFVAGFQSLDLIRFCAAVRAEHGHRVRPLDVFDHPTPVRLAQHLCRIDQGADNP